MSESSEPLLWMMNPTREISTVTYKFPAAQFITSHNWYNDLIFSTICTIEPLCTKATKLSRKLRSCEQHFNSESLIFEASH